MKLYNEIIRSLKVLAKIADAYDANELDDEARKFWGLRDEQQTSYDPQQIELYSGRGGKRLLTLADCIVARETLRAVENGEE